MFELGIKFLISYFLGSVMGALTIGKLFGNVDVRNQGSGNAGATNALRTQGFLFALAVAIIDIGKGILAIVFVSKWQTALMIHEAQFNQEFIVLSCASAAVIGHVFPIWHQFRGGKGAATLIGVYLIIAPVLVTIMLVAFILILILFGFVGLATIISSWSVAIFLVFDMGLLSNPLVIFSFMMAIFLTYTHRSNIKRMVSGEEPKNKKVMIFSK